MAQYINGFYEKWSIGILSDSLKKSFWIEYKIRW